MEPWHPPNGLPMVMQNLSSCQNKSEMVTLKEMAFNIVKELRHIWLKLNGTLIQERFNPIISEFVEIAYKEFMKPDPWNRPFSM